MLKNARGLSLDICDYNDKALCSLYDNTADVSGQATDVYVKTERNGWKELSFKLPATCLTAEGEEPNYRLQYLVADYRIRLQTQKPGEDVETDWFLVSEPKIYHDQESKTYEIVADHISSLLKTKNLGLEFSDEEGNNTGTIQEIANTILEGTGWHIQDPYYVFAEDENMATSQGQEKVRSFTAPAKTGAFKLMSDLCEKFDAKPVYHGEGPYFEDGQIKIGRTVEIIPMNPFSEVEGSRIPEEVMNGENVLELYYNRNISSIKRTLDSRNLVTKLYAYGAFGDVDLGLCSMMNCDHKEYILTINQSYLAGQEFQIKDDYDTYFYFKTTDALTATSRLVWSELDPLSKSYVYNENTNKAYKVYKKPNGSYVTLNRTVELVKNKFEYLMNFDYYNEVGLLTDQMLQTLAKYQREMPAIIDNGAAASTALIQKKNELSEVAESNSGFLRLAVGSYTTSGGKLKLVLDKSVYPDGVMYRSDYLEAKRNYFSWYCASQLKDNGDPVAGIGSVVYIIHDTNPPTWEKTYVKAIDDAEKTNEYGKVDSKDPSSITLWLDYSEIQGKNNTNNRYYLFCTNSISGRLGVKESELESAKQTLQTATKTQTEIHPTYFVWDNKPAPETTLILNSYGWYYRTYSTNMNKGDLYFCYGKNRETTWHPVLIADSDPAYTGGAYYFNTRKKTLYHGEEGSWKQYTDTEGKRLATNFSKVIYYCYRHDMIYKGLYDKYRYTASATLPIGNYAIPSDFAFYWVFSTDRVIPSSKVVCLDTIKGLVYREDDIGNVFSPEAKALDTIDFPSTNELTGVQWTNGTLNKANGVEVNSNTLYRSVNITLHPGTTYNYSLPVNSFAVFFDTNRRFVEFKNIGASGEFTASSTTKYMRISTTCSLMSSNTSTNPWRLNESDGLCTNTAGYKLVKYQVVPGTVIKVVSDDRFQFQTTDQVPSSGANKRVGVTYGTGTYDLTVPEGATHLIVSTTISNSTAKVYSSVTPSHYLRVKNADSKLFISDKEYTILNVTGSGDRTGIMYFIKKFADIADSCYTNYYPAYLSAQEVIRTRNNQLASVLGDLYREGYWQKNDYVEGDETKLYKDAMDTIVKIAKPEATYEINFLDLYGSNHDLGMTVDEVDNDPEWPDIDISDAVHLIDDDIDINCWAFIDKIEKCYDKPWQTKIEINTNLSLIGQKTFADVMTHIAEVANQMYGNQTLYKRAGAISGSGKMAADRLEGSIKANTILINGASSNWYTDEKGAIVLESADGLSAMKLTGAGFAVASSKDQWGDWNWRTFGTGAGFTADEIIAGEMSAIHLLAGSITVDQINASVGQELDIGSNRSLLLYSTVDGLRPAGSLQTQVSNGDGTFRPINAGDSYISIGAQEGNKKAEIDIMTGGLLYMQGSEMDLRAQSTMNILGSTVNIKSLAPTTQGGETLLSTMNITSGGSLNISSTGEFLVDSTNFSIKKAGENNYNVEITGKVTADEGKIAGFTLKEVDKGENTHRQFLQAGQTDSTTSSAAGVYIGTDGINIVGPSKNGAPISYLRFNTSDGASSMKIEADQIMLGTKSLQGNLNDINDTIADNAETAKADSDAAYAYADSKSQTFRCKSTEIVSKTYKVGDIWINTDTTTVNGQSVCFYHQYVCQKVSSTRNSTTDWVLAGTAITSGAAIAIDTQNGTIDIISGNTIRAVAGQTVSIAANNELTLVSGTKAGQSNGVVKIGNGTRPFTIGSSASEAYIYNGKTTLSDTTTAGIYIGTDGIRIGKGKEGNNTAETQYFTATAGGNVEISGSIKATSLTIAGTGISAYVDNKTNAAVNILAGEVARTYLLKADHESFVSEYTTAYNGLTKQTKFLQSDGTIKLDAFTTGTSGTALGLVKKAGITVDANGKIKLESIEKGSDLNAVAGISITGGRIDLTSLSSSVVNSTGLATTLNSYAKLSVLSDEISAGVWNELDQSSFTISSDKISIKSTGGLIISAGNLQLDKDGNMAISGGSISIKDGSTEKFSVTSKGYMKSISGEIGGWTINSTSISSSKTIAASGSTPAHTCSATLSVYGSPSTKAIEIKDTAGSTFYVNYDGSLHATGATVSGAIIATSGTIGSFTINSALYTNGKNALNISKLASGAENNVNGVYIGSDGIALGSWVASNDKRSKFSVTSAGALFAQNATITGKITADTDSEIGGWKLKNYWFWKGTGSDCVCLSPGTPSTATASTSPYIFWAGADWPDNNLGTTGAGWAPVKITKSGTVGCRYFCYLFPEYKKSDGSYTENRNEGTFDHYQPRYLDLDRLWTAYGKTINPDDLAPVK